MLVARVGVLTLSVLAVLLASACGRTAPAPAVAINMRQAAAYAAEINLRSGDLPGATDEAPGRRIAITSHSASPCLRRLGTGDEIGSPLLAQRGGEALTVRSHVFVQTAGVARFRPSLESLETGLRCEEHRTLTHLAKVNGESSLPSFTTSVLPLPSRLRGKPAYGVRIDLCGSITEPRCSNPHGVATSYGDTFEISTPPAVVTLVVSSYFYPPSSAVEQRLLSLLYSRVTAHKLSATSGT